MYGSSASGLLRPLVRAARPVSTRRVAQSNFSTGKPLSCPRRSQTTPVSPINYHSVTTFRYGFARFDMAFFSKLRGTVTYLWNPSVTKGAAPFGAITTLGTPASTEVWRVLYLRRLYEAHRAAVIEFQLLWSGEYLYAHEQAGHQWPSRKEHS